MDKLHFLALVVTPFCRKTNSVSGVLKKSGSIFKLLLSVPPAAGVLLPFFEQFNGVGREEILHNEVLVFHRTLPRPTHKGRYSFIYCHIDPSCKWTWYLWCKQFLSTPFRDQLHGLVPDTLIYLFWSMTKQSFLLSGKYFRHLSAHRRLKLLKASSFSYIFVLTARLMYCWLESSDFCPIGWYVWAAFKYLMQFTLRNEFRCWADNDKELLFEMIVGTIEVYKDKLMSTCW